MTASLHRDTPALVIGGTLSLGLTISIAERLVAEGRTRQIIAGRDPARGEAAAKAGGATCPPVDLAGSVVDFGQHVPGSCPE